MGDGDELKCNYLCIGAGTSTMSFVDTMLSSTDPNPNTRLTEGMQLTLTLTLTPG